MAEIDFYLNAIIERAQQEARLDRSATFEAEHLLLAIAADRESATAQILAAAGLDHTAIRDALDREAEHSLSAAGVSRATFNLPKASLTTELPKAGASCKLALERGFGSVSRKKDLRPGHLLLGILRAEVGTVPRALALAGVDQDGLRATIQQTIAGEGE